MLVIWLNLDFQITLLSSQDGLKCKNKGVVMETITQRLPLPHVHLYGHTLAHTCTCTDVIAAVILEDRDGEEHRGGGVQPPSASLVITVTFGALLPLA